MSDLVGIPEDWFSPGEAHIMQHHNQDDVNICKLSKNKISNRYTTASYYHNMSF